ncbi:MAG TPA: lysylphosphatidylglycerol synthase transmembrane domain-containing protein [Kofleriaceae bacterium]
MGVRRVVVFAGGLLVSAGFAYLALRGIDFAAVGAVFATAEPLPWIPVALALYVCGYFARGLRCQLLVRRSARLGLVTVTNIVVIGYASNNVLPVRLGELVRAGLLARRAKIPMSQSLGITFIERVFDGLVLLLMLVIASATITVPGWLNHVVVLAAIAFGIAAVVMLAGVFAPQLVIRTAARFGATFGRLATNVTNAGAVLRDPRQALVLVAYSALVWCFDAALYVLILGVFDIPIVIQFGIIAMCVTGFGVLLPTSPGFIGAFHYFASQALIIHGIDPATAIAYATLVHLSFYVSITLWGAIAVLCIGVVPRIAASYDAEER